MQGIEHFKTVFFEECADLLSTAESNLNKLSSGDYSIEDIHGIFRAVHSVKGGAGTFGFKDLVDFSHVFETTLDILRNSSDIEINQKFVDLLLRANDILVSLVNNAETGDDLLPLQLPVVKEQLEEFIAANKSGAVSTQKIEIPKEAAKVLTTYSISFVPKLDMMRFGNEPYLILRELFKLTESDSYQCTLKTERLLSLSDMNPENCYFSWEIKCQSYETKDRIEECFDFVMDDCELVITLESSSNTINPVEEPKATETKDKQIHHNLSQQEKSETPVQEQTVHSIRVELDRIDRLVNTVGEMVIKQSMLLDSIQSIRVDHTDSPLASVVKNLEEFSQYTRDLQESVMAIRAQPVKAVFTRMPRLVRELATQLNKEVHLEMAGENTEIDKTVIERLGEPLTHMIRNSVDHGIESPKERLAAGKPASGTIHLSAEHKSGRIVIQIKDDGKGIDRQRVIQKAIENGILDQEASSSLSHEEIDSLIFHPGFSTAQEVTNISGRGVGMDVVKKSIQQLGGRITIASEEGKGCTFNLMLPLTLAVLDGMIVSVGEECYVIPLINILETLRPSSSQVMTLIGGEQLLNLRQKNIPLVYLHKKFGVDGAIMNPTQGIVVVVETEGGNQLGLVVDDIVSQQQVVLKSFEDNYEPITGISAATILGNGRVSLILDVSGLKYSQSTLV